MVSSVPFKAPEEPRFAGQVAAVVTRSYIYRVLSPGRRKLVLCTIQVEPVPDGNDCRIPGFSADRVGYPGLTHLVGA
jgi:hypothetical protein